MDPTVIAIDGPAGVGKSVIGQRLARELGYVYFDTGALYRAITWLAIKRGADVHNGLVLARLAHDAQIEFDRPTVAGRFYSVRIDGQDVTDQLETLLVSNNVSIVAAHPEVRQELLPIQRRIAARGKLVMVGRDIGTVVVPEAGLKIFLTAPLDVRAARRLAQMRRRGTPATLSDVEQNLAMRDQIDQGRAAAPLHPAADAIQLDTSGLTIDEEIAEILKLARQR